MRNIYLTISSITLALLLSACGDNGDSKFVLNENNSTNNEIVENNNTTIEEEDNSSIIQDEENENDTTNNEIVDNNNTTTNDDTIDDTINSPVPVVSPVVPVVPNTPIEIIVQNCETYITLQEDDLLVKDEDNTTIKVIHDSDDTKKVCVLIGSAHIERGN